MYRKLQRSEGNALAYEVEDELTESQLDEVLADVEETIAEHGTVRLLVHVPSIPHPELSALDDDLGFWLQHGADVERYAVVGDSDLLQWVTDASDRVTDTDLEYFEDVDDAWEWVTGTV